MASKKNFAIIFISLGFFIFLSPYFGNQKGDNNLKTQKDIDENLATVKTVSGEFDKTKLKPDDEWKSILNSSEYHILREKGTELPFTGKLLNEKRAGTYYSVGCDQPVFRSEQKYDSGTGWPSFWAPISNDSLVLREDFELGYKRIEIIDECGGHLGHVFDDGPQPTGKRYCINSIAVYFIPD